jgi:hypothetical protein
MTDFGMPDPAATAWFRLRDELVAIAGDDLVAIWAYGSTVGADRPRRPADLDTHVVLRRRPDAVTAKRIESVLAASLLDDPEWDAWFITLDDARRGEHPPHAFLEGRFDESWALHRAHWLEGRFVPIHGAQPVAIVPPPTWDELLRDLQLELDHLDRHVRAGDSDPAEATYAVLNGSRILSSLETGNVVLSKREAGGWALEHLRDRWHAVIRAALRTYDGDGSPEDAELLAAEMAPFVAMVIDAVPSLRDPRHPG